MKHFAIALLLTGAAAPAQDFVWSGVSARSAALGGVYLPYASGVLDALSANPAGLTGASRPAFETSVSTVFSRGSFTNRVNTAGAPLENPAGIVPFAAFAAPLGRGSRWTAAAGVLPEMLSISNWNYVDAPGAAGGASYGRQRQRSAIVAVRSSYGLGFVVNRRLSLGFTGGTVYNTNRLHAPYIFQSHPALSGLKTLLDLRTSGTGWNVGAGLLARPVDRLQLSVAWKSRTVIESTGTAVGNLQQQLNAIGLGGARADFRYDAMVRNVLPQSVLVGASFKANPRTLVAAQMNFINWRRAFASLPVSLSNGNNVDINGLLQSNAIFDRVPLDWKNQFAWRMGVEHQLVEGLVARGGLAFQNSPAPSSTLSPLTAAILTRSWSTGFGYQVRGSSHWRLDGAYTFTPRAKQSVGLSALKGGEYAASQVQIGLQGLTFTTSYVF